VGNKEKKEVKKGGAPLSFSEMAKRPGNPQAVRRIPFPEKTIAQTNRPRAFFKVSSSVVDPFIFIHFGTDPDPRIHASAFFLFEGTFT
jgi:hypothetical protein